MAASSKGPVRTVMLGWVTFLLMTVAVVLVRGADHVANMAVFAAIGVAMLIWVALRRGRAALIASLVLGLLHVAEQIAYLLAGGTARWRSESTSSAWSAASCWSPGPAGSCGGAGLTPTRRTRLLGSRTRLR